MNAKHEALIGDHRSAVLVPVRMLALYGPKQRYEFVDRGVIRCFRHRAELRRAFDHAVTPEVLLADVERNPGIAMKVFRLGPGRGDRDPNDPVNTQVVRDFDSCGRPSGLTAVTMPFLRERM